MWKGGNMKCRRWGCWTWSQGSEHTMAWMVGNGELMSMGMDMSMSMSMSIGMGGGRLPGKVERLEEGRELARR